MLNFIKSIWRFFITLLCSVVLFGIVGILSESSTNDNLVVALGFIVIASCLICLIMQFFYDVTYNKILNSTFFAFFKTIFYYLALAAGAILCIMLCVSSDSLGLEIEDVVLSQGLDKFITLAAVFGALVSVGVSTFIFYKAIETSREKFWALPFVTSGLSLGVGIVFALLTTIIPSIFTILTWVALIASIILGGSTVDPLYKEIVAHKTKRTKNKSSSYSSSSSSSNHSSSSYSSSNSSSGDSDPRKRGSDSRFDTAMYSVAKNNSGFMITLHGNSSIRFNVSVDTYVPMTSMGKGRVTFIIGGECRLSSMIKSEYDATRVKHDIEDELQRLASKLTSQASSSIESLRENYKGYDCEFNITFDQKNINFKQA